MRTRRNWVWFFLKLCPLIFTILISLFYLHFYDSGSTTILTFNEFNSYILQMVAGAMKFNPIYVAFYNVFSNAFNISLNSLPILYFVSCYISYLVVLEIFRIMFEVLVFLPKFANSFFERKLGD